MIHGFTNVSIHLVQSKSFFISYPRQGIFRCRIVLACITQKTNSWLEWANSRRKKKRREFWKKGDIVGEETDMRNHKTLSLGLKTLHFNKIEYEPNRHYRSCTLPFFFCSCAPANADAWMVASPVKRYSLTFRRFCCCYYFCIPILFFPRRCQAVRSGHFSKLEIITI